jgi:hypothetical protein
MRPAKWGSGLSLHSSNPELVSASGQKPKSSERAQGVGFPPKADIAFYEYTPSSTTLADFERRGIPKSVFL